MNFIQREAMQTLAQVAPHFEVMQKTENKSHNIDTKLIVNLAEEKHG